MQMMWIIMGVFLGVCSWKAPAGELTVAAVQTELRLYTTAEQFSEHMAELMEEAVAHEPDLIVFPENVGIGLLALGAPEQVMSATSMDQVMGAVMAVRGQEVMQIAGRGVPLPRALMLVQAPAMRAAWVGAFSALAVQTDVYIAAGTIPLPHEDSDSNEVYNTFFLFGPDGEVTGTADKVNLIPLEREEGLNLTPGRSDDLAPWVTPIGVFAPIVCADAWDANLVAGLVEEGAQLLLCPSANPEHWTEPVRLDRLDGLHARVDELGVPGVECFGVGELGGLPFEGVTWILAPPTGEGEDVSVAATADAHIGEAIVVATITLPDAPAEK
mgnify:CR=1 FL=1